MLQTLFFAAAACAIAIGVLAFLRDRKAPGRRLFAMGLALLAFQSICSARIASATSALEADFWRGWWFVPQAMAPPVWLFFTLKFARGNFEISFRKWLPVLIVLFAVPMAALLLFPAGLFRLHASPIGSGLELGFSGFVLYVGVVLSSALILMNLERTFRAAVGAMRWQIKYLILGTACLYTAKFYTASQVLLFKSHPFTFDIVSAVAMIIACLLFLRGLLRAGLFNVQVYPSEQILQFSIAGVLVGAYLIFIGISTKLFEGWQGPEASALKAFFLLASLTLVGILLLSEMARDRLKRWVSRHFHRPYFDYRATWLSFTEKTGTVLEPDALCRVVTEWLSEKLHVLSTSIWLVDIDSSNIRSGASTGAAADFMRLSHEECALLVSALQKETAPFDLADREEPWAPILQRFFPDHFPEKGGNRVCVPLISNGKLVGFFTLGDRVNNVPLALQEFELLRCVADQVAVNLLNLQLTQSLMQAKELEAFQTIAAFFVHDLKNTVSTLNLTLQNMPKHFDNPEFRKDALRSISRSVEHIQALISRLTLFRDKLQVARSPIDLNQLVRSSLESIKTTTLPLTTHLGELKFVLADAELVKKVITNLVLNAREAIQENGSIELATEQQNGSGVLIVRDNGSGMSPEFLAKGLFRPFKTTKKGGIGIGMFQTKAIVEAHGGRIEVQSDVGKGTTFKVFLPSVA